MELIELAALPARTPLIAALAVMRAKDQSGVVSIDGSSLHLATAADVVVGLYGNEDVLSDLEGLAPVSTSLLPLSPFDAVRKWIVSEPEGGELYGRGRIVLQDPHDRSRLTSHFNKGHDFAVVDLGVGRVTIVAAHDYVAGILGASPDRPYCSCKRHVFHNFPLIPGTNCPLHACPVLGPPP